MRHGRCKGDGKHHTRDRARCETHGDSVYWDTAVSGAGIPPESLKIPGNPHTASGEIYTLFFTLL